jgi:hypothetical protein
MRLLLVLLLLPVTSWADYQSETFKRSVCEDAGNAAALQAKASNEHKDIDVAAQLEKGKVSPAYKYFYDCTTLAPVRKAKELAGYGRYDPKDAYMRAWSYCMDNIERCQSESQKVK